jgi:hypothetical protein
MKNKISAPVTIENPVLNTKAQIYYDENRDSFCFRYGDNDLLEFRKNGDISIRGNKLITDKEVVYGIREWCKAAGVYPRED